MKNYPDELHGVPSPEKFDLGSCSKSELITVTYNQATKSRILMEEKVTDREKELSCKLSYLKLE